MARGGEGVVLAFVSVLGETNNFIFGAVLPLSFLVAEIQKPYSLEIQFERFYVILTPICSLPDLKD